MSISTAASSQDFCDLPSDRIDDTARFSPCLDPHHRSPDNPGTYPKNFDPSPDSFVQERGEMGAKPHEHTGGTAYIEQTDAPANSQLSEGTNWCARYSIDGSSSLDVQSTDNILTPHDPQSQSLGNGILGTVSTDCQWWNWAAGSQVDLSTTSLPLSHYPDNSSRRMEIGEPSLDLLSRDPLHVQSDMGPLSVPRGVLCCI